MKFIHFFHKTVISVLHYKVHTWLYVFFLILRTKIKMFEKTVYQDPRKKNRAIRGKKFIQIIYIMLPALCFMNLYLCNTFCSFENIFEQSASTNPIVFILKISLNGSRSGEGESSYLPVQL